MLIGMAEINYYQASLATLSKMHPNECTGSFPYFLVDTAGKIIVEKDGSLPKRITFLGHTKKDGENYLYHGYSSDQFVANFIKQLETAIKINPKVKDSITCIDLLGCNTGFVSKEGNPCFAKKVATLLKKAGYDIQVKAVTNLGFENKAGWDHINFLHNPIKNTFYVFGFSSMKNRLQYNIYKERIIKKIEVSFSRLFIQGYYTVIVTPTNNIREELDKNAYCNFSLSTVKENTPSATATNVHTLFTTSSLATSPPSVASKDCKSSEPH